MTNAYPNARPRYIHSVCQAVAPARSSLRQFCAMSGRLLLMAAVLSSCSGCMAVHELDAAPRLICDRRRTVGRYQYTRCVCMREAARRAHLGRPADRSIDRSSLLHIRTRLHLIKAASIMFHCDRANRPEPRNNIRKAKQPPRKKSHHGNAFYAINI